MENKDLPRRPYHSWRIFHHWVQYYQPCWLQFFYGNVAVSVVTDGFLHQSKGIHINGKHNYQKKKRLMETHLSLLDKIRLKRMELLHSTSAKVECMLSILRQMDVFSREQMLLFTTILGAVLCALFIRHLSSFEVLRKYHHGVDFKFPSFPVSCHRTTSALKLHWVTPLHLLERSP